MSAEPATLSEADVGFAPVDNELPLQWFRRLHLVLPRGLGTVRRALFFAAVAWLPIVVWAALTGHVVRARETNPCCSTTASSYAVSWRCLCLSSPRAR